MNRHRPLRTSWSHPLVRRAAAAALALALAGARPVGAAETQWWVNDGADDYVKCEARGLVVRPEGVLELGPLARFAATDSLAVVWAAAVMKDGSLALAGDRGRVLRYRENGGFSVLARLPVGQVLSLAVDGDGVVAGTGPEGLVYRIGARGDTTLIARTGERYVWGLAPAQGGGWYAATGTRGRLMRLRGREATVVLDTDESNLVSMVPGPGGTVYAGGDSRGRVYAVGGGRGPRTVFDAGEDEVRSLAIGADGALYAAALSASAVSEEEGEPGDRPTPVRSAVKAGRAVIYRIVPDSVAASLWTSPQPFVFALAPTPAGMVVGTGNRAGLYLLDPRGGATQWLQSPQGQITALAADGRGGLFAATSNPAGVWRIGPGKAPSGEVVSQVFDARRYAAFGAVRWHGEARGSTVRLSTRSGNTDPLDSTWSAWAPTGGEGRSRSASPPARYFQWRLEASGGAPHIESVEAAWRERNLPPRVEELTVAPQGQGFREGGLNPRAESVTQTLPGGQKVEYSNPGPAAAKPVRDLPSFARGLRTLQWRGVDPNGDALRYTVQFRAEPDGDWITVDEGLEATLFTWDTGALPDGRYRVRVVASDAAGNPLGEALTGEGLSTPFTVDNTPPAIPELAVDPGPGALRVSGRAEDAASPITRIELSLDNDDWRTVSPEVGFADERSLAFRVELPGVAAGAHTVSVRAVDFAGNTVVRARAVTVPRGR